MKRENFVCKFENKFSYHTTAQKLSLESSHKPNSTVPIFNKSKKSIQT